jgi:hypothetical protein
LGDVPAGGAVVTLVTGFGSVWVGVTDLPEFTIRGVTWGDIPGVCPCGGCRYGVAESGQNPNGLLERHSSPDSL